MTVYKGSTKESDLYHGSTSIGEAYYGNTKVYSKEPWYRSDLSGNKYSKITNGTLSATSDYYGYDIDASNGGLSIIDGQVWNNNGSILRQSGRGFIYSSALNCLMATSTNLYATNGMGTTSYNRLSGRFTKRSLFFYNTKGLIGNGGSLNYVKFSAGYDPSITSSTVIKNYTSIILPESDRTMTTCIIDGDLYKINSSTDPYTLTLIDSGNWTDVCGNYGIKNGNLYYINTSSNTVVLKDNTETYSKKIIECRNYYYAVTDSGNIVVCNGQNVTKSPSAYKKGRWDSVSLTSVIVTIGNAIGIRNGALYYFNGPNTFGLIDDTRFYTKCSGGTYFGICVSSGNRILRT